MAAPEIVKLQVRLPGRLHAELTALARAERSSLNREIVLAVEARLRANPQPERGTK